MRVGKVLQNRNQLCYDYGGKRCRGYCINIHGTICYVQAHPNKLRVILNKVWSLSLKQALLVLKSEKGLILRANQPFGRTSQYLSTEENLVLSFAALELFFLPGHTVLEKLIEAKQSQGELICKLAQSKDLQKAVSITPYRIDIYICSIRQSLYILGYLGGKLNSQKLVVENVIRGHLS